MLVYAFYESDSRVRQYAEALASRGDVVDVLSLRAVGQQPFEVLKGVNVYRIQKRVHNETRPLSYLLKILRFLMKSAAVMAAKHLRAGYSVIHVHSVPDFAVLAALLPKLAGAKVILDIHDIVPEFYASKFSVGESSLAFRGLLLVERISTAIANHVIVANDIWRARLVARAVNENKCTTVLNYPDPALFGRRPRTRADGKFVALFPGTLNRHQGVDVAVRAFKLIKEQAPEIEFHVYGEGQEKENLKRLVEDLKLEDRVFFHRLVALEEIAQVMANADLGVEPKRAQSFGNEALSTKIREFMAVGVPVLTANTEAHRLYFSDSVVKFFESGNCEDLARGLVELSRDRALRELLVNNAAAYIEKNSWDHAKLDYLTLVDQLATGVTRR